jgi:hypothetical protein
VLLFDPRRFDPWGDRVSMSFRHEASRLAVKLAVCLAVAGGCAFVGCSGEYGTSPSMKSELKEQLNKNPDGVNQGAKGGKKVFTKSIKQKVLNATPDKE